MQSIAIHQAKNQLSALIHAVEQGEEVVLTRHGRRIARIIREPAEEQSPDALEALGQQALEELNAFRASVKPDPGYQRGDWKNLRDEGRRY
ncbi:type II toxin-antitoxin system prevent-host-death family antitoxin [Variovorax sp. dw_954]|uniref:type II toxin-antitoxin system Phd/YefM family antitoxin n=1 Tax=Variovorax sp. dw_954 TaxID=2720078 RepID=UPI001BD1DFD1|nr:type II toxin-antitoxin system prevent-host-death family antitoxin [Variovorax sp. dw_954]